MKSFYLTVHGYLDKHLAEAGWIAPINDDHPLESEAERWKPPVNLPDEFKLPRMPRAQDCIIGALSQTWVTSDKTNSWASKNRSKERKERALAKGAILRAFLITGILRSL